MAAAAFGAPRGTRDLLPDDLVLIFGDQVSRGWKQIAGFTPDLETTGTQRPAADVPTEAPPPAVPDLPLGITDELIRDERGVRLAREIED